MSLLNSIHPARSPETGGAVAVPVLLDRSEAGGERGMMLAGSFSPLWPLEVFVLLSCIF